MDEVTTSRSKRDSSRGLLVVAVLLLVGILVTNVYTIVETRQQSAEYQEKAEAARDVLEAQREVVFDLEPILKLFDGR